MRLRFCWARATTFPSVMLSTASTQKSHTHSPWRGRSEARSTRRSAVKAAALDPGAMKAVTEVGAVGNEGGDGGGGALEDSGGQHVEGHGGDLEADANQEEGEADEEQRLLPRPCPHRRPDLVQVGRARGAVDEGDAVKEEAGG